MLIASPKIGGNYISSQDYLQMSGRAGRKGLCTHGCCVLMGTKNDENAIKALLHPSEHPVKSCLKCHLHELLGRFVLECMCRTHRVSLQV